MKKAGLPGFDIAAGTYTPVFGAPSTGGTSAGTGLGNLEDVDNNIDDFDIDGALASIEQMYAQPDAQSEPDTQPVIAINPGTKKLYVNGFEFDENDAASALVSRDYLAGAPKAPAEGSGYRRLPKAAYDAYLAGIENPTTAKRFTKSFATGVGSLQELWGAALLGASGGAVGEEIYKEGVNTQERLAPFAMRLSQIKNADDAGDYFVSLVGSQAPQILETVVAALIGSGVGAGVGASGGPVGATAGGIGGFAAGLTAKGAVKTELKAIAEKVLKKELLSVDEQALWREQSAKTGMAIRAAAQKKLNGEVLTAAEQKLVRQGAAITGALTVSTLENYGIGYGDIRSEQMEQGVDGAEGANQYAALLAVPYAALSTLPEFGAALAFTKKAARPAATTMLGKAGDAAGRVGSGAAAGAVVEGPSEALQEGLVMGGAEQFGAEYSMSEKNERYLEAGVAGAVIGGAAGGPLNLLRPKEKPPAATPPASTPQASPPTAGLPPEPTNTAALADEDFIPAEQGAPEEGFYGEQTEFTPPQPGGYMGGPEIEDDVGSLGAPAIFPSPVPAPIAEPVPGSVPTPAPPVPEPVVAAPPVVPGQEGTLFADADLGGRYAPPAQEDDGIKMMKGLYGEDPNQWPEWLKGQYPDLFPAAAAGPAQAPLLTEKGAATPEVKKAVLFGATKVKPGTKGAKALLQMVRVTKGQVTEEAAKTLGSAEGVSVQPFNLDSLFNKAAKSVVKLRFSVGNSNLEIAYDEDMYGSPEAFAEAMGIDYALFDTGTFQRVTKDGAATEPLGVTEYAPPPAPPEKKELKARAAKRATRNEPKPKPTPPAPTTPLKKSLKKAAAKKEPAPDVQERSPAPVDAEKPPGPSARDGSPNTAGDAPAGARLRKPKQTPEPATEAEATPVGETSGDVAPKSLKDRVSKRQEKAAAAVEAKKDAIAVGERVLNEEKAGKAKLLAQREQRKEDKDKDKRARATERFKLMKFTELEELYMFSDRLTAIEYEVATKEYLSRLAVKNIEKAKQFVADGDSKDPVLAKVVAELKAEGLDLTGKKPSAPGRFSKEDEPGAELPENILPFDEHRARQAKGSKNSIDRDPTLVSIMAERAKRGMRPFKPNADLWDRLTDSEREQWMAEYEREVAEQAEYENARQKLLSAKLKELIADDKLTYRPGDLVHITAPEKRSLPWKILDYFVDPANTERFGYTVWHPDHGAHHLLVNDPETDTAWDETQIKWDEATTVEKRAYHAAEKADLEDGGDRLQKLKEEIKPLPTPSLRTQAIKDILKDEYGISIGDRVVAEGVEHPLRIEDIKWNEGKGNVSIIVVNVAEGVTGVLHIRSGRFEQQTAREMFDTWTKMGGPKGSFSLSPFDQVTNPAKLAWVKLQVAKYERKLKPLGVTIRVFANQQHMAATDPGFYDLATKARQRARNATATEAGRAPRDFLPIADYDPELFAVRDALYENRDIFLVNPTLEEIYAHVGTRKEFGMIKLIATKQGNVIVFHTSDAMEHVDAAQLLAYRGDYGRAYLFSKQDFTDYKTMTPREYAARPDTIYSTNGDAFKLDEPIATEEKLAELKSRKLNDKPVSTADYKTLVQMAKDADAEGDVSLARTLNVLARQERRRANNPVPNDFDAAVAAGYAFGDNQVIIFTDRIKDAAHLQFVLAHETGGHVGLAAYVGQENVAAVADWVYENSEAAQRYVERRLANTSPSEKRNFSRQEATEEFFADLMGEYENLSFIQKLIYRVKEFMARMGWGTMEDAQVHSLLLNVRRYTRTGKKRDNMFVSSDFVAGKLRMPGRFTRTRDALPVDETWFDENLGKPDSQLNRIARLVKALYSNEEVLVQMKERYGSEIKMSSLKVYMAQIRNVHGVALPYNTARNVTDKMQLILDAAEAMYKETGGLPPLKDIAQKLTDEGSPTSVFVVSQYFSKLRKEYAYKKQTPPPWIAERPRGFAAGNKNAPGRYSLANPVEFGQAAGALNRNLYAMPREFESALDFLKGMGVNAREGLSRLTSALKTMNFAARSNSGYQEGYQILNDTANLISELRTKYNSLLDGLLHEGDEKIVQDVSEMLQFTAITKLPEASDKKLRALPQLLKIVGDQVVVDMKVFNDLKAMGRYTLEEFRNGIEVEYEDSVVLPDDTIATKKFKRKLAAKPGLTETSQEWLLYVEAREAMDQAALDRVRADYYAASGERRNTMRRVGAIINRDLTAADERFLLDIDMRYRALAKENSATKEDGSVEIDVGSLEQSELMMAAFNQALIARTEDKALIANFAEFFPDAQRAAMADALKAFRAGTTIPESLKFDVQRVVSNMAALELGKEDSELHAKRSLVGGYVPVGRQGDWQVRLVAVDDTGRVVKIDDAFRHQMPYFQVESRSQADVLKGEVETLLGDAKHHLRLPVFDQATRSFVVKDIKLEVRAEAARTTPTGDTRINMNEFTRMLSRFGVPLHPKVREKIVIGLTAQNARARQNLQREGVPGADPNSVPFISQHLEALANISGRRQNQHRIDILLDEQDDASQRLWNMDLNKLKALKRKYEALEADPAVSAEQAKAARREYDAYAFAMKRTAETGGGNKWKDKFVRDMAFLDAQKSLDYADFGDDGLAADVKTFTAVAQLGGSFATAALNVISLPFNVLPALAYYNTKRGFGGGFGLGRTAGELTKALGQVGGLGKYQAGYYDAMLDDPAALAAAGLTREEAEFLANQIARGSLQASMTNALTGSARGKYRNNMFDRTGTTTQKFTDAFMSGFTYTEQASRRAAALAAYRMHYERGRIEGKTKAQAIQDATAFATDMIGQTLGQYNMFNRPNLFRGGIAQFIFMYKMYPIMTVQLLQQLPLQGQLWMLAAIWFTAGLKGMPFGEDILDMLETIGQMLGWKVGSVEGAIVRHIDSVLPGASAVAMRGVADQLLPGTLSTRTGFGNMIPGTSIGIAGSDPYREITEVLGPAYSAVEGAVGFGVGMTKGVAALTGLGDRDFDGMTLLRDNPVTLARAIGDTLTYMDTGAIVDSKGYVVSEDVSAGVIGARLLGFYPSEATRQNDIIRMSKRTADYQRAVSTEFRLKYVRAALAGDDAKVRRVIQDVKDWNEAARGSGLEISNFTMNANRALREAKKSATSRFEKSAPNTVKPLVEEYRDAYGIEE